MTPEQLALLLEYINAKVTAAVAEVKGNTATQEVYAEIESIPHKLYDSLFTPQD
jgi:hypothetical protein